MNTSSVRVQTQAIVRRLGSRGPRARKGLGVLRCSGKEARTLNWRGGLYRQRLGPACQWSHHRPALITMQALRENRYRTCGSCNRV